MRIASDRQPEWALLLSVAALLVVAAGSAVGGQGHRSGPARAIGVVGTLQTVGGPAPGLPRNVPGSVVFHGPGRMPITSVVGEDGTFAAKVPPGTYTVVGFSPSYAGPCDGVSVTVPSALTVHVYCQEA